VVTVAGVSVDWTLRLSLDELLPSVVALLDEPLSVAVETPSSRLEEAVEAGSVVVVLVAAVACVWPIGPA
jgi:hypothetical protein